MEKAKTPIMFADGVVVEEDNINIFLAGDPQNEEFNITRLAFLIDNKIWEHHDVDTVVSSVCVTRKPKPKYYALGRDGRVFWSETRIKWHEEKIQDAGTGPNKYGYVSKIREIEETLYVCGHRGQVYCRTGSGWVHMDKGLLTEKQGHVTSHHAIDGTAVDDIYVAGNNGKIFHYNGKKWTDVSPETNVDLLCLQCVSTDKIYVGGDNGLLYCGNRNGWKLLCEPSEGYSFWDIKEFKNDLYIVFENKLAVYHEDSIVPIDTKLDPPPDAYHLSSLGNILWSFGEEDLAYLEGETWTRVIYPDNVI